MKPPVIELRHVGKRFRLHGRQVEATSLKSAVVELFTRRRQRGEQVLAALRDVNLAVQPGRMVGVIGRNGSGKSTLLKLIAGIYRPDAGEVVVRGRVAALIELGAGFHPELTGRENVMVNGIVLGLSRREIRRRMDDIVRFAELGEFVDEPARTYSSGMYMRLGFAVAVHVDPEILLVDEVFAVGDEAFARKCADRIMKFRRLGKTIVLVTHDTGTVERWCDQAVWLDRGEIKAVGAPQQVVDRYHAALAAAESDALAETYRVEVVGGETDRWGSREIEITRVRMSDAEGRDRYVYEVGEPVHVSLSYRVNRQVRDVVFGFAVLRGDGLWVYGTNTALAGLTLPDLGREGEVQIVLEQLDLVAGSYFLDVAVHARDGNPYDYHSRRYPFTVRSDSPEVGVARLRHRWHVKPA